MFKEYNLEKIKNNELNKNKINDKGLTDEQTSIYAFVIKKRRDNKHNGQIKGGTSVKRGD